MSSTSEGEGKGAGGGGGGGDTHTKRDEKKLCSHGLEVNAHLGSPGSRYFPGEKINKFQ